MRRTSSKEAAAAFLSTYAGRRGMHHHRRHHPQVEMPCVPPPRIVLDVSPYTLAEIMDCVAARVRGFQRRGERVPHITAIALKMLHEATAKPRRNGR
jgi:hypothetical protein